MARPIKNTVDYFTHDADASDNSKTVGILENHFGLEGYAAWFKLLERISTADNHVIILRNPEDMEFFSSKLKIMPEKAERILDKMAELGAIDSELWQDKIIWCQNFVDRMSHVYENRKRIKPTRPTVVKDNNGVFIKITWNNLKNTDNNPITIPVSTHSIVEYSIVYNTIVEGVIGGKQKIQEFKEYVNELKNDERFNTIQVEHEVEKFLLHWSEGKKKLKRPKLALLNWMHNAIKYQKEQNRSNQYGSNKGQPKEDAVKQKTTEGREKYTQGKYSHVVRK